LPFLFSTYIALVLDLKAVFLVQNLDTKVLACHRAITARMRIKTIHIISPAGMKEFAQ
jgi:hypothetical protein